jgi:FkbM family methyltransferase
LRLLRAYARQEWIRFGLRDRVLRRFCNPDTGRSFPFETNFFGLRYRGDLKWYIDWLVYFYGAQEKQMLFLLRDIAKRITAPVFLDIGANVGVFSLYMSRLCSHVHSFEPFPAVREELERRIRDNGIRNICVHGVALGDRTDELDFYAPTRTNRGTGSFVATWATDTNRFLSKLPIFNGDEYLDHSGIQRVSIVKIDVEGFEVQVLSGVARAIQKNRPVILMEWTNCAREVLGRPHELSSLLPRDYHICQVESDRPLCVALNLARYRLRPFRLETAKGNVLILPGEFARTCALLV